MMQNRVVLLLVVVISSLIGDSNTCFTKNVHHDVTILKSGDTFYQECICEEFDRTLSTKNLKWYGPNNKEIPLDSGAGLGTAQAASSEWGHRLLKLYIPNLSRALAGTYKCVSQGENGQRYTISYKIDVYDPLYFIRTNQTQYIINGQDSLVRCEARGYTAPLISWHKGKDGLTSISNSDKYELKPDGLLIKKVSRDDAGDYHCNARVRDTGEDVERHIKVDIMKPPVVEEIIPIVDTTVTEGEPLTLDCKATGFPLPTYYWRKLEKTEANETWHQDFNKLLFENVTIHDQGTYQCIAQNTAGESRMNISIKVLSPPSIVEFNDIEVAEESPVTIACGAIGRPQPNINITYYAPEDVRPPEYTRISNDTYMEIKLLFDRVMRFHDGYLVCNASNSVGYDIKTTNLTVYYKPYFKVPEEMVWIWNDKIANLSCEHDSEPKSIIQWSYQGNTNKIPTPEEIQTHQVWSAYVAQKTDNFLTVRPNKMLYGTYECLAKNHLGEAKKVFQVKEGFSPSQLADVNVTEIAATSVTFDVVGPGEYPGPPVIGYTAEYDELEMFNKTHIHVNRTWAVGRPYKMDKLKPNTKYFIRFAAVNQVGSGPFSHYILFETPEKSAPEPVPIEDNFEPILIPANNKKLKFKSPEHNGDPIDYIAVKYCQENSTDCIEEKITPTSELQLDHLTHNTSYYIEMVAHNSVGNSTPTKLQVIMEANKEEEALPMSAGAIIGVSIVVVVLAIIVMDAILFVTKKQGIIASCYQKKSKNKKEDGLQSKDKKGLLKDSAESAEALKRTDNGHKEFEYNKSTGVITGKHSAV